MTNTERKEIEHCRDLAETIWQSDGGEDVSAEIADLKDTLARLLSAPSRNCDIGTAEEQGMRFKKFCNDHQAPWHGCTNCPVLMSEKCAIAWEQMPYEEGAVNDSK